MNERRKSGKKIVHCHGVFDLLHIGHIRHYEQAKQLGDLLVVTLTGDQYVNKGPNRPAFPQDLRAEAIAAAEKELADSGRVVIRYSGTEALARVMIEAESEPLMRHHAEAIASVEEAQTLLHPAPRRMR